MFLAGMLYFSAQIFSLAGVPVTMPASRQSFVVWRPGAIWFVLKLPRPSRAKPSFRVESCAETEELARFSMGALIAAAPHRNEVSMNWRRDCLVGSRFAFFMEVITRPIANSKIARTGNFVSGQRGPDSTRNFLAAFAVPKAKVKLMTSMRLKDQPLSERPRERLAALGPEALSPGELVAILLRTGLKGTNVVAI